jgi:hypothetical protein
MLHPCLLAVFFQLDYQSGSDDDHANPLLVSGQVSGPAWLRAAKTFLLRPFFCYIAVSPADHCLSETYANHGAPGLVQTLHAGLPEA